MDPLTAIGLMTGVAALFGAGIAKGVANNARVRRAERRDRRAYFAALVEQRGWTAATFDDVRLTFATERFTLAIEVELAANIGVGVTWTLTMPPPGTVAFDLAPRTAGTTASDPGELALERAFVVEAEDAGAMRALWTAERRALLSPHPSCRLRSDGTRLVLTRRQGPLSAVDLDRGVGLLLAIVDADVFGMGVLHAVEGARPLADGVGVSIEGPGGIRIGPEPEGGRTVTRARADASVLASPLEAYALADPAERARLPTAAHRAAAACGATRLAHVDGELVLSWDGIERERDRLAAGVRLLRQLTTPSSVNVFR